MRMGSGEGSTMRNFIVCTVIKSRRLRWTGHVARMEEGWIVFDILTGKLAGKRPLGRPGQRWEDNIRLNLKKISVNMSNWIDSAPRLGIIGELL